MQMDLYLLFTQPSHIDDIVSDVHLRGQHPGELHLALIIALVLHLNTDHKRIQKTVQACAYHALSFLFARDQILMN